MQSRIGSQQLETPWSLLRSKCQAQQNDLTRGQTLDRYTRVLSQALLACGGYPTWLVPRLWHHSAHAGRRLGYMGWRVWEQNKRAILGQQNRKSLGHSWSGRTFSKNSLNKTVIIIWFNLKKKAQWQLRISALQR